MDRKIRFNTQESMDLFIEEHNEFLNLHGIAFSTTNDAELQITNNIENEDFDKFVQNCERAGITEQQYSSMAFGIMFNKKNVRSVSGENFYYG